MANNRELSQFASYVEVYSGNSVGIATTSRPYIGIGTDNPQEKFHVVGNIKVDGNISGTSISAPAGQLTVSTNKTGSISRTLSSKISDYITVKDFGAIGDGINDDRFALNTCQENHDVVIFPPGEYYLGGYYTFYKPTVFLPGAKIKWGASDIVTFSSPIDAEPTQIFNILSNGTIAITDSVRECYPEWFGAVTNNGSSGVAQTNLKALKFCVDIFPVTILQGADYFISDTLNITSSFRTIQGVYQGPGGDTYNSQTRILVTNGSSDAIKIYTPSPTPGNFNSWNQRITINDVQIARTVGPVVPASGNEINGPTGIRMEQIIWVFLNRVTVAEHFTGVLLNGTIRVTMNQVISLRVSAGTGPHAATNDKSYHFWLNGYVQFGLAGGNASTYFTDCTAGGYPPGKPNDTIGFYLPGAFVDTFLQRVECTEMGWGIYLDGSNLNASQQKTGCADVHIVTPILDAVRRGGIGIFNTSKWTAINILGGYMASGTGSLVDCSGIRIDNCNGLISINNYQTICWPNAGSRGLYITNSSGVKSSGGMTHGSNKPIELVNSSNCSIEEGIVGHSDYVTTDPAVVLNNSIKNYIRPIIYGDANSINGGVKLLGSTKNRDNEINCTNIDSSCIIGGVSKLLVVDGVSITSPGRINTGASRINLASGILEGESGDLTTISVAIHRRPPTGRWSFGQNITKISANSTDNSFNVTTRVGIVTVSIGDAALPPLTVN